MRGDQVVPGAIPQIEGVAIGLGSDDPFRSCDPSSAGFVHNNEGFIEIFGSKFGHQAGQDIG